MIVQKKIAPQEAIIIFISLILIVCALIYFNNNLKYINSQNTQKQINKMLLLNNFEEARSVYNSDKTDVKLIQKEQINYSNYIKGLSYYDIQDKSDTIKYLSMIDSTSQYYNEAKRKTAEASNIKESEDSAGNRFTQTLAQAHMQENNNKLDNALNDFILAYQIANVIDTIKINESIDDITNDIFNARSNIQNQSQREVIKNLYSLRVPILMYHYIRVNPIPTDTVGFSLSVTPSDFENQMKYLSQNGYTTITIQDMLNALKNRSTLPPKPIILTFDDGYDDFYKAAFPVLRKYNLKAESYIITNFVGKEKYMTWDMIHQIINSGLITIGAHTLDHPDLRRLPLLKVKQELTQSKAVLEKELKLKITDFCYPYGGFNQQIEDIVKNAGYLDATTTQLSLIHYEGDLYNIPRVRIAGGLSMDSFIKRL